jgi:hypothetical protein
MVIRVNPVKASLIRQVNHWIQATSRLSALDHLATGTAWHGIDVNSGKALREALQRSIDSLNIHCKKVSGKLQTAEKPQDYRDLKRDLIELREHYIRTEETLHFYTDALNTRTTASLAALLRACDFLCIKSMNELLTPLGKQTPPVITYIDKGIGASILKAGLRLWDGNISPVAAIKVTQHNLFRPTSIIHETGHQVAHILNWNNELQSGLISGLKQSPKPVQAAFGSWASEIAADAFAFAHTGYAAVSALHDVVSGQPENVFAFRANDPHPISYVRVFLGIEMCRKFYGHGPWDRLAEAFMTDYDINLVDYPSVGLIKICMAELPRVVDICLKGQYKAFSGQSLALLVNPEKVSPQTLERLEYIAGPGLYTSHAWIWKECIRLLALTGYKISISTADLPKLYKQEEEWMIKLGFSIDIN